MSEWKRSVVNALERCCNLFHWIPPHRCRLARLSMRLNDKWKLGYWPTLDTIHIPPEEQS